MLKRCVQCILFVLAIFASSPPAIAEWYPVLLHSHCYEFSDGSLKAASIIREAKSMGYAALIETDHYKSIYEKGGSTPSAFAKYRETFSSQDGLVVIPAAEVNATAHILAVGENIVYDEKLLRLYGQNGAQQAVLDRIVELGLIPIAAHPSLREIRNIKKPGDFLDMTFDWANARGLLGVEVYNDGEFYQETLEHLIHGRWFVTAGCDQHGALNPALDERWQRITWVWVDGELTKEKLLAALREGHTYAARSKVRLIEINYIPGFEARTVSGYPEFRFVLDLPGESTPGKVTVYRDGARIGMALGYRLRNGHFRYHFEDRSGELFGCTHSYILELKEKLLTSPIIISVPSHEEAHPAHDGWRAQDATGANAAEFLRAYIYQSVAPSGRSFDEMMANPENFPGLARSSFASTQAIRKLAESWRKFGYRSGCQSCSLVYEADGAKFCDVHLGLVETSGKKHCSTWFTVLDGGIWKIRSAVEDCVNQPTPAN